MKYVERAGDRPGLSKAVALVVVAVLATAFLVVGIVAPQAAHAATLRIGVVDSAISANTVNLSGQSIYGGLGGRGSGLVSTLGSIGSVSYVYDNDLTNLSTLENYDVLVMCRTFATTETQRNILRTYVARGGGIVALLDMSHWDYVPSRSPQYNYFGGMWGFSQSDYMSRAFEWGELSELVDTRFVNDPFMPGGYYVNTVGSHPIIGNVGHVSIKDPSNQYNELVSTFSGNSLVTPLATYGSGTYVSGTPGNASGWLAAWAVNYYYGRIAYYGFQLSDLAGGNSSAKKLLLESAKWAGASGYARTYGSVIKSPSLSGDVWYWGNDHKICVDEYLGNVGNVQLRGSLGCQIYNPSGSKVYDNSLVVPISPGDGYTYGSWQLPESNPASGVWRAHLWYSYYDYLRGGYVAAYRDLYFRMNGTSVDAQSFGAMTLPGSSLRSSGAQIAGADRVETAVQLSRSGWPSGLGTNKAVILARSDGWNDALAAAPLAGKLDAPILITPTGAITDSVRAEIKRLYTGSANTSATIYVVSRLSDKAVSQVWSAAVSAGLDGGSVTVKRLAGPDCYSTAANIARTVGCPTTGTFADTAIIASGVSFPDALSMSAFAAKQQVPILFTGAGSVPAYTGSALHDLGVKHSLIVGGTAVVGAKVESSLESAGYRVAGKPINWHDPDTRIAGASRYDTSLSALDYSIAMGGLSATSKLFLCTGTNYPDALALAPVAAKQGIGALLVNGWNMGFSPSIGGYLSSRRSTGTQVAPAVTYVGGTGAITSYVRGQVSVGLHR